jgi:alpha-galactosidase
VQQGTPEEASGAYWMSRGIDPDMRGDFQATAIVFDRIEAAR